MRRSKPLLALFALAPSVLAQTNDECIGALPLIDGVPVAFDTQAATLSTEPWSCAAGGAPDLWYALTTDAPPGTQIRFETCGSGYDTALDVWAGDCGALAPIGCNDDACGLQSAVLALAPGGLETYYVRVGGYSASTGTGSLLATVGSPSPCTMPDALEPNIDCSTATPLGDGTYSGLAADWTDNDYYALTLAAGATLNADILFTDADGDLDLYLWDPSVACDTNVAGAGTGSGALAVGFSASDDESITYTNTSAEPLALVLEVDMFTQDGCNSYALLLNGTSTPIGSAFCAGVPNSTGAVGSTDAVGSLVVADNDLVLVASNLPPGRFGIFVASAVITAPQQVPSGNLCLGGTIVRAQGPGQVQVSDAGGRFSMAFDLQAVPTAAGPVPVQPGETWGFQAWHRDVAPGGVNTAGLTSGVEVTFQ